VYDYSSPQVPLIDTQCWISYIDEPQVTQ